MENLKVIENELVPVYETSEGEKVVYGSDLHKVLGVKSRYNDWIRNRIRDCDAQESLDYEVTKTVIERNPNPKLEHIIRLNLAMEICLLERNEVGKRIRRHFCNRIVNINNNMLPNYSEYKSIYVMNSDDMYKVGVSNNPYKRLMSIRTGNPKCNLIFQSIPIFNSYEIESLIHNKLKNDGCWINGEWFKIDDVNELFNLINLMIDEHGKTIKCA